MSSYQPKANKESELKVIIHKNLNYEVYNNNKRIDNKFFLNDTKEIIPVVWLNNRASAAVIKVQKEV